MSTRRHLLRLPAPLLGLVLFGCLSWAPPVTVSAQAQTLAPTRVLVMPFAASVDAEVPGAAGGALWLGEAASILIEEGLSGSGLQALTREERVAAFERLQLPMSSALTRATMIRVGELVGASEVVFGEVHLGTRLEVRARVLRIQAGRELSAVSEQAPLSDIFALLSRVAARIGVSTGRPRTAVVTGALQPMPLGAFESYVKGLVAATRPAAQRFLESAIREAPNDSRVLMALWSVYRAQAMHEKALAAANAVSADSPVARAARYSVALSLIDLKRLDGAYKELLALYGGGHAAAVSNALGIVQLRRGAAAAAAMPATTYFARAIDEDPDNTDYLFNLGYAYAVVQNTTDALTWLREAVRFDAAHGDAHLVMSAVLSSAGRTAEAQRELDLARLLGTGRDGTTLVLSTRVPSGLERLNGDLGLRATPRLNAAIANPAQRDQRETAAFHLARARDLVDQRKDRDATSELRRAIYLAPYEDEPHLLLGRVYLRTGQPNDAIDEFKVAIWCRETLAARLALGGALLDTGEKDAARKEAERALAISPASPDARALLKRIGD